MDHFSTDIVDHFSLDKYKPETKSASISLFKPGEKPTCLSLLDFKYRNNKLDMNIVYRAQNVFFKQPGNLIALRGIQNKLAKELGFEVGNVNLLIISAHIYEVNYDEAINILKANNVLIDK